MNVKEARKHISNMLDLIESANRNNMDFYPSKFDAEATAVLLKSTQKFSKRIEEYLDTQRY